MRWFFTAACLLVTPATAGPVADMSCTRSGLSWNEGGGVGAWANDERTLPWTGDRLRHAFDRRLVTSPGPHLNDNGGLAPCVLEQVAATHEHAGSPSTPPAPAAPQEAAPVETRAILRAFSEEDGGARLYVHLKIAPTAQLPFTTLRFRVRDRALLAGLREGASVKFRAGRADGENTLLAIRAVPPCVRFQPCD